MFNVRILGSILPVAVAVLGSMIVTNGVFVVISAAYPNWLPRQFFGVDFLMDNRQRAQLAANEYRDGTLTDADPFVVILGLSSASEGINLTELSMPAAGTRVLGLGGGGRNIRDVQRYAAPLLDGGKPPTLVVFAISPFHLVDPTTASKAFFDNMESVSVIDELGGHWLISRRQDLKYAADVLIDRGRSSLRAFFDVRLNEGEDPWREFVRMGLPQAKSEIQWENNVTRYAERGYYAAESYLRSEDQIDIFLELVARFREWNSAVIVVLMPEHSRLRERIPDAAKRILDESLEKQFGGYAPKVVDLRGSVPDVGFKDISHMNKQGRRIFSPIFEGVVAGHLSDNLGAD